MMQTNKLKQLTAHALTVLMLISTICMGLTAFGIQENAYAANEITFTHPGGYELSKDEINPNNPPAPVEGDYCTYEGEDYAWNATYSFFLNGNNYLISTDYENAYREWIDLPSEITEGSTYHFRYKFTNYDDEEPIYSKPVEVKIKSADPVVTTLAFAYKDNIIPSCDRNTAKGIQEQYVGSYINNNFVGKEGNTFTVTIGDSATVYTYNGTNGFDYENTKDFPYDVTDDHEMHYAWKTGEDFTGDTATIDCYAMIGGQKVSTEILVKLTGSQETKTVTAIQFTPASPYTLAKSKVNENDPPQAVDGDKMTLTYSDGSTKDFIYATAGGAGGADFYAEDGEFVSQYGNLDRAWKDDQSFKVGDTPAFVYKLDTTQNVLTSSDVTVTIVADPDPEEPKTAKSLAFVHNGTYSRNENDTQDALTTPNPVQGDQLVVTYTDDSTETFTYSSAAGMFVSDPDNMDIEAALTPGQTNTLSREWKPNQTFKAGNTCYFNYKLEGTDLVSQDIPVAITGGDTPTPTPTPTPSVNPAAGMVGDNDLAGSTIMPLRATSKKQTKNSITVNHNAVTGAAKYVVYGNKCNSKGKKYQMVLIGETTSNSLKVTSINGVKLKKGTYHKFFVVALDANNNVISTSKVIHVVTKGGKYKNYTSVKVSNAKKFKKLKAGKSLKIKAKAVGSRVRKHVGLRYESSNPAVATVTAKGKVKAVSSGTATITVYAQNGKYKNVKVTVK